MSFKTTIVLLVLLAAGAAVIFFMPQESSRIETDTKTSDPDKSKYVFDPQPDDKTIVRVSWERKDKPRIVFERSPKADKPEQMDDWKLIEPIKASTETYMVDAFMRTFLNAQARSGFEAGKGGDVTTEASGLAAPASTVTMTAKDGKDYKLEVGKKAAMSDDTYVRIAGQTQVHRTKNDLTRELNKDVKDFRSKRLFNVQEANARKLSITYEGKNYAFSKSDAGDWVIDEPVKAQGNKDKILTLIRSVNAVYVDEFVSDAPQDLAKFGLAAPTLRVSVTTETKRQLPADPAASTSQPVEPKFEVTTQTHAFDVGSFSDMKEQKRFIKPVDQNWVATAAATSITNVTPKLNELRDPEITRIKAAQATDIEIAADGETASLKQTNGAWTGSGDLTELDKAAVADVLEAFEDLKAISFIDSPDESTKTGLDAPRATVKVTATGAVAPVTLRVGGNTASGRHTYVQLEGQPTLYVVDAEQARRLIVKPLSLRSRVIFSAGGGQIRKLDITRGPVHYALTHENNSWKMTEPPGANHDANGVNDISRDLPNLMARRVAAKGDFENFGFSNPAVTVKFTVEHAGKPPASQPEAGPPVAAPTETSEHTIIAARKDNVPYCRIDDNAYVFELDETVYRVLTGELIDRKLFAFKEEDVKSVAMETPGLSLPLEKRDGKWIYTLDPYVELTQKNVKDFVTELAAMRVEEYTAYNGGDLAAAGLAEARGTLTITLNDKAPIVLKIEPDRGGLPRRVGWVEKGRIFTLRAADAEKLTRTLDYYIKPAKEAPQAGRPGEFPEGLPGGIQGLSEDGG